MNFKIIGSGGCVSLPKPLCQCKICIQARKKGHPYARYDCSLFLEDLNLLVDTPEDICEALNYSDIRKIDTVVYSHMDPDHTLGMRVFEQLRLNWLNISKGIECTNPIKVLALQHVIDDLNSIRSKYGPFLDYYENVRNLINREVVEKHVWIDNIKLSFIKAGDATVFVFEEDNKKLIYAPCDVKPFPDDDLFKDADIMVIGNTIVSDVLKDDFILTKDNPMNIVLFTMNEIKALKEKYNINKVFITHLEEDWGKSYDDYIELEKQYDNIYFAYDGMEITP